MMEKMQKRGMEWKKRRAAKEVGQGEEAVVMWVGLCVGTNVNKARPN